MSKQNGDVTRCYQYVITSLVFSAAAVLSLFLPGWLQIPSEEGGIYGFFLILSFLMCFILFLVALPCCVAGCFHGVRAIVNRKNLWICCIGILLNLISGTVAICLMIHIL